MSNSCSSQPCSQPIDYSTVKNVDLGRYMGRWYEIARFDHRFERGMVGVTATYTAKPNGTVKVVNAGFDKHLGGRERSAIGRAKVPDLSRPGHLKVAFFLWFWADYNIMELDTDNYSYVMIGGNSPAYLWIMSRTPEMDPKTLDMLIDKARKRGYDTSKLIMVEQPKNSEADNISANLNKKM